MKIKVNRQNGRVYLPDKYLARENDNIIQTFDIEFDDEFLQGIGQLDFVLPSGTKGYINMELNEQTYSVPIYNSLCQEGTLTLQFLVFLNARFILTSDTDINPNHTYYTYDGTTYTEVQEPQKEDLGEYYVQSVPLYHSKQFTLVVDPSINATLEENEEYPTKLALINAKLLEIEDALDDVSTAISECENATEGAEKVNISQTKTGNTLYVTTTDRNGDTDTKEVYDGADGKDAKINGYNTITIVEGTNIDIEQEDNVLTINNTLSKTSELTNDSGYITKDVNDLTNYSTTTEMNSAIGDETTNRQIADNNLQNQIDAITSASDVVDVVSTYQDLLDYDTSKLTDKDVIKVMQDSTHSNAISYYRWTSNSWSYIGSEGPFYTKGETDTLLNAKQDLIDNSHKLSSDLVDDSGTNKFVSASDITNWNNKVSPTDFATSQVGGVVRIGVYGTSLDTNKVLRANALDYATYGNQGNNLFIAKGTLENVIAGKGLIDSSKIVNATSTTAGETYDVRYINTMIGDIETILTTLDIGNGVS